MRKKIIKLAIKIMIALIIVAIIYYSFPLITEARAGGGGNTGGSASSSSSNNSSGLGIMGALIAIILLPIIMLKNFIFNLKERTFYTDLDYLDKWEYKALFIAIQSAWSSGDMEDTREKMDSILYKDFQQKLAEYKRVNKRNVVTNIQINKVKVSRTSQNKQVKQILFEGTLIDYFEVDGVPPDGEINPISFKDIWLIERTEKTLIVRDIQNL